MRTFLLPLFFLLFAAGGAQANPCALPGDTLRIGSGMGGTGLRDESGMGGSGHADDGSGMGGTGIRLDSGIGGTGVQAGMGDSGLGGTGRRAGSGIGGTGIRADGSGMGGTGVVGVITGFASICVNGTEIHYNATTPVTLDGQRSTTRRLAIGQVVSVEAAGSGPEMRARRITLNSALVGPVSWVSPAQDAFVALGQRVRLSRPAPATDAARIVLPKVGDRVRVSGLRDADGAIRATHVERIRRSTRVSLTGTVEVGVDGRLRIGEQPIQQTRSIEAGDTLRLNGRLRNGVLQADRVDKSPDLSFSPGVKRLLLQGVMHRTQPDGTLSLGYARIQAGPGVHERLQEATGNWVRVEALRRPDGRLIGMRMQVDRPEREVREAREGRNGRSETKRDEKAGNGREDKDRAPKKPRESVDHRESARKAEGTERHERAERMDRTEKLEKIEKVDKVERAEKIERPESVERPEKTERPEKPETIEKPEKPEKVEKVERPEKPERHEKDD